MSLADVPEDELKRLTRYRFDALWVSGGAALKGAQSRERIPVCWVSIARLSRISPWTM